MTDLLAGCYVLRSRSDRGGTGTVWRARTPEAALPASGAGARRLSVHPHGSVAWPVRVEALR